MKPRERRVFFRRGVTTLGTWQMYRPLIGGGSTPGGKHERVLLRTVIVGCLLSVSGWVRVHSGANSRWGSWTRPSVPLLNGYGYYSGWPIRVRHGSGYPFVVPSVTQQWVCYLVSGVTLTKTSSFRVLLFTQDWLGYKSVSCKNY